MPKTLSVVLRPYLYTHVRPVHRDVYLRFYSAATKAATSSHVDCHGGVPLWSSTSYKGRVKQLNIAHTAAKDNPSQNLYPRISHTKSSWLSTSHRQRLERTLEPDKWDKEHIHMISGKIKSIRAMSKHLLFLDVVNSDDKLQVMCNLGSLLKSNKHSTTDIDHFRKIVTVGDNYSFTGFYCKNKAGQLLLSTQELPQLLAPSLHLVPDKVTDEATLARFPQLELVMKQERRDLLRLRHVIERAISIRLDQKDFTKVTTPILAADTGGASAQAFETATNEIPGVPLRMRIAPELGLKQLIAAGMGPVYEIGPCFRNEGLDATHNPEFSTCEFYLPFANLETLMRMTEDLITRISNACFEAVTTRFTSLNRQPVMDQFLPYIQQHNTLPEFAQLPFLPTLVERIRAVVPEFRLPRVLDDTTAADFIPLFQRLGLDVPTNLSTAHLLDVLAARFIEPLCQAPTFITEHPAIMSPLSKSYTDPRTGHLVSARAELFIGSIEYANLYEEENDPFAQARKFAQQAHGSAALVNTFGVPLSHEKVKKMLTPGQQYYVRVLEMGLPPTGGWGCGIDRLVMLFGGAKRIGDVLPFGGLRSVIAMGTGVDVGGGVGERAEEDGGDGEEKVDGP